MHVVMFWEMMPCSMIEICRIFEGTIGIYPEDGNIMYLQNVALFIHSLINSFRILPYDRPHTYLLTPWSRVIREMLTGFAASQEIPRIYGTPKFITVLTSARHLSLS
jgi:hypothetical protein